MKQPISKLGIGPMSTEVINAVYQYSHLHSTPLMLIASKNQIDWSGGYVNGWNTAEYTKYCRSLQAKYSNSKVYLCRDHCGPGFNGKGVEDAFRTIDDDIKHKFDVIHVDFSKHVGNYREILKLSQEAIKHIIKNAPETIIEVGTDENTGKHFPRENHIEKEMELFAKYPQVHFYVSQTGSLIKEINQAGTFNSNYVKKIKKLADKYKLSLKEHNADYLSRQDIALRKNLISAQNVAPQFGVIQTALLFEKALLYGIELTPFLTRAFDSHKWLKWLSSNSSDNKFLCSLIAGHYVFNSIEYRAVVKQIARQEDFSNLVISSFMQTINQYIKNL